MMRWLRRLRGALGIGVMWALGWALFGGVLGLVFDAGTAVTEMWMGALLAVGFTAGTLFSGVLGIAGRRRRFDELSLPLFTTWGAVGGALLGLGVVGLVVASGPFPMLRGLALLIAIPAVGSALSAAATLQLARLAEDRALLEEAVDVDDVGLSARESRELLEGR